MQYKLKVCKFILRKLCSDAAFLLCLFVNEYKSVSIFVADFWRCGESAGQASGMAHDPRVSGVCWAQGDVSDWPAYHHWIHSAAAEPTGTHIHTPVLLDKPRIPRLFYKILVLWHLQMCFLLADYVGWTEWLWQCQTKLNKNKVWCLNCTLVILPSTGGVFKNTHTFSTVMFRIIGYAFGL